MKSQQAKRDQFRPSVTLVPSTFGLWDVLVNGKVHSKEIPLVMAQATGYCLEHGIERGWEPVPGDDDKPWICQGHKIASVDVTKHLSPDLQPPVE